jgi:hypothetical protein
MAIKGRDPMRSKIVKNCNIIKQIIAFSYLGCSIEYQNIKHITVEISKLLQVLGIIN